jgi:hypothetical protein
MLGALQPKLKSTPAKSGTSRTSIEHFLEQNFREASSGIGFELFMSTLSAQKFLSDSLDRGKNIFRNEEREIRKALISYLESTVRYLDWDDSGGRTIIDFVRQIDWKSDFVLTFNYDQLLESAADRIGASIADRVLHLHGAIGEQNLAWPTYTKFAYRTTKTPLGPRWKQAFEVLRDRAAIKKLVFIGYSMPASDLEAKGLFNYTDWYNQPANYEIVVVNPSPDKSNYAFFRKAPIFREMTLAEWLIS